MASKFLSLLSLLALAGSSLAGVATYSYSPYAAYHHVPAAVTTYASPAHQVVYHHAAPAVYHHAPVVTKSYFSPAPLAAAAAPLVKTVAAAPAVQVAAAAPVVTKTVVAAAPTHAAIVKEVEVESAPRYDFSYGVHDSLTGDIKSQAETRTGGNVAGSYSVVDADGYKRTVTYTADDLNGFNAVVQREPIVAKVTAVAAPAVQQVVSAQPVVPVQQQYLQYLPQQSIAAAQPVAPASAAEPVPVEYPEQQPELVQQQPEQPQYPQDQHYPPYPRPEGDDSDVVDVRSINNSNNAEPSSAAAPAPVAEAAKEA